MKQEKPLIEQYKDALNYHEMFKTLAEEYKHEAEDIRIQIEKQNKENTKCLH